MEVKGTEKGLTPVAVELFILRPMLTPLHATTGNCSAPPHVRSCFSAVLHVCGPLNKCGVAQRAKSASLTLNTLYPNPN